MNVLNHRQVDDNLSTSGQPSEAELREIAEAGYELVINLAPHDDSNALEDEPGHVQALGLDYINIPVDFGGPTADDFRAFEATLAGSQEKRLWVHCAANYRVTAFIGLYAMKHRGWTSDRCDEFIASVWNPDRYPVWRRFIDGTKQDIESESE